MVARLQFQFAATVVPGAAWVKVKGTGDSRLEFCGENFKIRPKMTLKINSENRNSKTLA